MRKIIIKIETDSNESFELIKDDIERELSCCCNYGHFDKVEISEGEKMKDPVERADVIEIVRQIAIDKINVLPSEQPEQRWIPVTERLPDQFGWDENYLVALAWGGVGVMEYKSTGWHNYGSFSPVPIEVVTAWMPLPEAYREEGDK